jgi:tetratricopeptide (TPR) repeat protein
MARTGNRNLWMLGAACAGLAAVAYADALHNPFVYDDRVTVAENASLRTPTNIRYLLGYSVFRPLVNLSYAADYSLWGLDPFGYHLTSVALHMANVALLFALVWRMLSDLGAPTPALAAVPAALFSVHPLMTEAVGYVAARSEVLCGLFALTAVLWARRALLTLRARDAALATLALLLGLAAKELAAAVPILVLAYDWLLLPATPDVRRRRAWRVHAPLWAIVAVGAVARVVVFELLEPAKDVSIEQNLLVQVAVFWRYLGILLWPRGQSIVHEFSEVPGGLHLPTLASAAAIAVLVVYAVKLRQRAPLFLCGVIWLVATLAPSSVFPLSEAMAEHRMYLPSIGCFLGALAALNALGDRVRPVHVAIGLVPVVAILMTLTVMRNRVWSNPLLLWQDATEKSPSIYATHYALGDEYRLLGDCKSAIVEYQVATALRPDLDGAWLNLGICRAQTHDFAGARHAFERARAIDPHRPTAPYNLGLLAEMRGDLAEARRQFEATLALDPAHERARARLHALEGK